MTIKDYTKFLKQVEHKPAKKYKIEKHNKPHARTCGVGKYRCSRCGRYKGQIRRYGLNLCRQCFREIALELGFKKYGHEV